MGVRGQPNKKREEEGRGKRGRGEEGQGIQVLMVVSHEIRERFCQPQISMGKEEGEPPGLHNGGCHVRKKQKKRRFTRGEKKKKKKKREKKKKLKKKIQRSFEHSIISASSMPILFSQIKPTHCVDYAWPSRSLRASSLAAIWRASMISSSRSPESTPGMS